MEGLSVIIPVKNELELLKRSLHHLKAGLSGIADSEILVCNDEANSDINSYCQQEKLNCIDIAVSKGSYHARNCGIRQARYESLLFIDTGLRFDPDLISHLFELSKSKDYVASIIEADPQFEISPCEAVWSQIEWRSQQFWDKHHFGPTALLLVNNRIFEETGYFYEEVESGADMELGLRCWHANIPMHLQKKHTVYHPPRTRAQLAIKLRRVLEGHQQLRKAFPNRLGPHVTKINLKAIIRYFSILLHNIVSENSCQRTYDRLYFQAMLAVYFKFGR